MRIKRLAFVGTFTLLIICCCLYLLLDKTLPVDRRKINQQTIHGEDSKLKFFIPDDSMLKDNFADFDDDYKHEQLQSCPQPEKNPKFDVQMGDVYNVLPFDNPDGGVWKQGWPITYSESEWSPGRKLRVFVVPHSHNDPGWKKTFEEYYQSQTRSILNNMVVEMSENPDMKFIWAEISFFSLWWSEISRAAKVQVKRLIRRGQLEIVGGGWVMPDEANTHYFSIVEQLMHGHQWLMENLNYTPKHSWSIDPFGLTPTLPIILKESGFKALAVQRSHYSVKKYLAQHKQLEFRWRQLWDAAGDTDLLTHMMPFYSYDVPHTCGPDPKICCQFDFRRLPGLGMSCPWKVSPKLISDANVAERAAILVDQYKKKSQLYSTNVLLVPLGDDFRYDHQSEWKSQYSNYKRLFDHINSNENMNTHAQFGTLYDYFMALEEEKKNKNFPTLAGDFFTYADRDDHYWSGYYTSRPYYKRIDRVLLHYVRCAEILFSMATRKSKHVDLWKKLWLQLSDARSSHSLFQHHDGITGTAKDYVVQDYASKMYDAINKSQHVIQQCAYFLLSSEDSDQKGDEVFFTLDREDRLNLAGAELTVLTFPSGIQARHVTFWNPLTRSRREVVTLTVENQLVQVKDKNGKEVAHQITPLCPPFDEISRCYQLSFVVEIGPLAMVTYTVEPASDDSEARATIKLFDRMWMYKYDDWDNKEIETPRDFTLENNFISARFSSKGFLQSITLKTEGQSTTFPTRVNFIKYSARMSNERSGAYIFLPDGPAQPAPLTNARVTIVEGRVKSQVFVHMPNVIHVTTVYHTHDIEGFGVEINNLVNIASVNSNYELAMRISSNIENDDVFFTDLNGFQMIKRKRFNKIPLQGNYYPLPTAAYIEDQTSRLTLLTGQPSGVASLESGQIEVMQDRRLLQDDNRGLDQSVRDNRPTLSTFKLLVETRHSSCSPDTATAAASSPWGSLTESSALSSDVILHPIARLIWHGDPRAAPPSQSPPSLRSLELPPNRFLVTVHALRNLSTGVVFSSRTLNKCFSFQGAYQIDPAATVNISAVLPFIKNSAVYHSTLTFNRIKFKADSPEQIPMCDNQIKAFFIPNY